MFQSVDSRTDFSIIPSSLPAVIPPTTRLNFIKNWWQRSEKTSSIAEARILQRIYQALPQSSLVSSHSNSSNIVPIFARIGRITIDKEQNTALTKNRVARQINTLYISQRQQQTDFQDTSDTSATTHPFQVVSKIDNELLEDIQKENSNSKQQQQRNLVICHGYGAGLGFFYRNYHQLSQEPNWRIFALDWLGMGNSSRPKWTISKHSKQTWNEIVDEVEDHFVESLEQWRQKVGIKKMTLFGHSLGGYFAACYALKYPEKVEKLILVSPAGIPENTPEERVKLEKENSKAIEDSNSDTTTLHERLEEEANQIGAYYQAEAAAAENAAKMQQQQEQVQRLEGSSSNSSSQNDNSTTLSPPQRRKIPAWATYLWDRNITPMSIIRMIGPFGPSLVHTYTSRRFAHLETAEQHDLYDYIYNITSSTGSGEYALAAILAPGAYARKPLFHRLANLKMPTVFIYGEQDWMDYKAAEKAKKFMKVPVKVIRIPHGGHHMYLDNPDDFNEAVRAEMKD